MSFVIITPAINGWIVKITGRSTERQAVFEDLDKMLAYVGANIDCPDRPGALAAYELERQNQWMKQRADKTF